jgi:hypothetical protein
MAFGPQYVAFVGEHEAGNASLNGAGTSSVFRVGGTPFEALVIGVTLEIGTLDAEFQGAPQGAEGEANMIAPLLGPFVDWYPNPRGPWHLGAALGLAGFSGRDAEETRYVGRSAGGALFAGYDAWIGPQFSIGITANVQGSLPANADGASGDAGYAFSTFSAGVQSSLLYH